MDELLATSLKVAGPLGGTAVVLTSCVILLWKYMGREWVRMRAQQAQAFASTTQNCVEAARANLEAATLFSGLAKEMSAVLAELRRKRDR